MIDNRYIKGNMVSFQKELRKRKGTYDRIIEWKELADKYTNEIRSMSIMNRKKMKKRSIYMLSEGFMRRQ
ncbi:MAG TPA: hypothetical protein ENI29_21115 [bacterium]|nr:hypothetical protein [bacterium]